MLYLFLIAVIYSEATEQMQVESVSIAVPDISVVEKHGCGSSSFEWWSCKTEQEKTCVCVFMCACVCVCRCVWVSELCLAIAALPCQIGIALISVERLDDLLKDSALTRGVMCAKWLNEMCRAGSWIQSASILSLSRSLLLAIPPHLLRCAVTHLTWRQRSWQAN